MLMLALLGQYEKIRMGLINGLIVEVVLDIIFDAFFEAIEFLFIA